MFARKLSDYPYSREKNFTLIPFVIFLFSIPTRLLPDKRETKRSFNKRYHQVGIIQHLSSDN